MIICSLVVLRLLFMDNIYGFSPLVFLTKQSYKKYHMHLRFHNSHSTISLEDINRIMSETKRHRSNSRSYIPKISKTGFICVYNTGNKQCGSNIFDLPSNLFHFHVLSRNEVDCIHAMKDIKDLSEISVYYSNNKSLIENQKSCCSISNKFSNICEMALASPIVPSKSPNLTPLISEYVSIDNNCTVSKSSIYSCTSSS